VGGTLAAAGAGDCRHAPHPSFDRILSSELEYGAVLSIWDRLFGTYTVISRAQRDRLLFGVRELLRRECLKPSAMLLTPWRIRGVSELTNS
jgi:hypothetical protein